MSVASGKDRVGADRQPNDMRLAGPDFWAVGEDGPAVTFPRHLEGTRQALDALDAEASSKLAKAHVLDEPHHRPSERITLRDGQPRILTQERLGGLVDWQPAKLEGFQKVVAGIERASATGRKVCQGLPDLVLPLLGPKPRLRRVDLVAEDALDEEGSSFDGVLWELIDEAVELCLGHEGAIVLARSH